MCRHDTRQQRERRSDVQSGPREERDEPEDDDGTAGPDACLLSPSQGDSQSEDAEDHWHEH